MGKDKKKIKKQGLKEKDKPVTSEGVKVKVSIRFKISLSIMLLVAMIILSISSFFIYRESKLLENQIVGFIKRELFHLSSKVQQNLGYSELNLSNAINNLKKISYIEYAYILSYPENETPEKKKKKIKDKPEGSFSILYYFDKRGEQVIGEKLNDNVKREFIRKNKKQYAHVLKIDDSLRKNGKIYDFSTPVYGQMKKTIAVVIIGMSNIIIREEVAKSIKAILIIALIILVIAIISSVVLASIIIRPVKKLSYGANVIGQGNLDHKIEIKSSDEFGILANEFNTMTKMIKEAKNKEIESRLMEEQLELAKDIQEGLNPMGFYDKKGIQIKGFTKAAKGVGGDYFDYLDIDENKVCALISDVSGKGVPASLVMVMIRTVFTTFISTSDVDPAKVVQAINNSLSADFAIDKFATLFFLIYDRSTGELAFCNAGHGPLICYRAAQKACSTAKLDGVPIGIMDEVEYKQAKVKLNPGDVVVLYTDGVTEMRNVHKEEYGFNRVKNFILNNHNLNAEDFVNSLVDDVNVFKGDVPPHDDETIIVFKRVE
jgi:serine phosphatase RsbU (regulator of sigma subunit)